jgi:hypothetical protein
MIDSRFNDALSAKHQECRHVANGRIEVILADRFDQACGRNASARPTIPDDRPAQIALEGARQLDVTRSSKPRATIRFAEERAPQTILLVEVLSLATLTLS